MLKKMLMIMVIMLMWAVSNFNIVLAQETTVAVIGLEAGEGVSERMAVSLSDYLCAQLFNTQKFTIVTREKLEEVLKEHKIQLAGITREGLVKAGQLLGVNKIFTGSVGKIGATYLITLKVIDIKSGKIERVVTERCTGREGDSLYTSVQNVANKITDLPTRVKKRAHSYGSLFQKTSLSPPTQQKLTEAFDKYKACATWVPFGLIPFAHLVAPIGGIVNGISGDGALGNAITLTGAGSLEQLLDKSGLPYSAREEVEKAIGWYKACSGWATVGTVLGGIYVAGLIVILSDPDPGVGPPPLIEAQILTAGFYIFCAVPSIGGWICGVQGDAHLQKAIGAYNVTLSKNINENKFLPHFSFQPGQVNAGLCYRF